MRNLQKMRYQFAIRFVTHNERPRLTDRQSAALLAAIKEYEASKWKFIGQKVGKPAKVNVQWNSTYEPTRPCHSLTKTKSGMRAIRQRAFRYEILKS